MCGISVIVGTGLRKFMKGSLSNLEARGPEGTQIVGVSDKVTFGFTRLAINGLTDNGMQPFTKGPISWMCNGEIYNSKELEKSLGIENAGSDCFCIGDLYLRHRDDLASFARALDGVFALAVYDSERDHLIIARDPYGIRPLFAAASSTEPYISFASEIKGLPFLDSKVIAFPPGTIASYNINTQTAISTIHYHTVPWVTNPMYRPSEPTGRQDAMEALRFALEESVRKRMLTERSVAALLSGGLDSSLIAALVQTNLKNLGLPPLKTFSIGFEGSEDLKHARIVADWIGSDHNEIIMTPDEFFDTIPEVIKAIESYDTTTVRASVGNYLIAKKIRELCDCKVVFNGDGADELFGGYLYFNNAPNDQAFHAECGRLLENIFTFDVLRSDRSISANGLEARTPFLDKQFVSVVRSIDPAFLRPIRGSQVEKSILRDAFDDGVTLPSEVLFRRKEAFSDGVSSPDKAWFQEIHDRALKCIPYFWKSLSPNIQYIVPRTPEEFYYRKTFEQFYSVNALTANVPYIWMPKWCPETSDPSARTLAVYTE